MTKQSTTLNELFQSKVELQSKKQVGKNPPPKLPQNRPKAVPSIPSATVAPPEDKATALNTFYSGTIGLRDTEKNSKGF